jgi:hypothetical protein
MSKTTMLVLLMLVSIGTAAAAPPLSQREKLRILSAQMINLEDQIYSEYNKFNSDHQYDIVCSMDLPTDTHFKNRQCLPAYIKDAQVEAAMSFLDQAGLGVDLGSYPGRPVSMVALGKRDAFKKNFRKVFMSHAELLKLDHEYAALEKNYQTASK